MATQTPEKSFAEFDGPRFGDERPRPPYSGNAIAQILAPLASLRLTVALFAMAIFLVFVGTLAQVDKDIWEVMGIYFRSWVATIDVHVFFPKSFFPSDPVPRDRFFFFFPGGWVIGGAMAVNLLAAHGLRFKVQASGSRLLAGLAVIAAGIGLTTLVVLGGADKETIEGTASMQYRALWDYFKLGITGVWLVAAYFSWTLTDANRLGRLLLRAVTLISGILLAWLWYHGDDVALGDSSMRILWQLIKAGMAGFVLLAGCKLVFRKRAGIVLLHAGVGLMMLNELVVSSLHVEGQMNIREGETAHYTQDIRTLELAVVDSSDPKADAVVVIPRDLLENTDTKIHDKRLPFGVEVTRYFKNAELKAAGPQQDNPATAGAGLQWLVEERRPGSGTDTGGKVDLAAAYLKLTDPDSGKPLGTYLVSQELKPQKIEVDGKTYEVALRFKRSYKPYSMHLDDVRFDKYLGTQMAKNYSSDLRLVDPEQNVNRKVKIWMNNPLRFAGETFYQSSYGRDASGTEVTTLQVVTNTGWMIPYVACMIVATGMLDQFLMTLVRFLRRRSEDGSNLVAALVPPASTRDAKHKPAAKKTAAHAAASDASPSATGWVRFVPLAVVIFAALYLTGKALPPRPKEGQMHLYQFGELPLVYEGRVKPFDTLARNSLRMISDRQTYTEDVPDDASWFRKMLGGEKKPAIRWLLDVITHSEGAFKLKVFRIENLELLETLGLERRSGFRYSVDEFRDNIKEFEKQAELAHAVEPGNLSTYQKKVLELDKKIRLFTLLATAFDQPSIRPGHEMDDLMAAIQRQQQLSQMQVPLAVPPTSERGPDGNVGEWEPYTVAWTKAYANVNVLKKEPNPAAVAMNALLASYAKGEVKSFNSDLAKYEAYLREHPPADLDTNKVDFEAFFNHFEPFYYALILYVFAFIMVCVSWLGWSRPLQRSAFWLIAFTLCLHTAALVARIYISGRPPVTNLYSSAVFIGWGCVVLGLIFESIYRLTIGMVVASVAGFATLLIAHFLASGGDTFVVLQAVLDTQFWLATHVTCITLGYATTYIAGLLGIGYIAYGLSSNHSNPVIGKDLCRMIYGTVCFGMFFSFVGTVLGGLWADDSWGRFWGWDPKENGALIIVLWNALVLHARWGGMVKDRGLAMLAVGGNIVTSWSWFGVNELGVGLHSYGFTEGVLKALGIFVATQLVIIGMGFALPKTIGASADRGVAA